jgi:NAD-dependent dihydropyrimidine dehydrogenase PreA subunit
MTYVINEKCIGSVDQSCVEVCPVSCIYAAGQDPEHPDEPLILLIDPEECIDCGACVPECPVEAITPDDSVPERFEPFTGINAEIAGKHEPNAGPAIEDAQAPDLMDIAARAWDEHQKVRGEAA